MPRLKPNESTCSAARSLEILGDRWTLLLIREVVFGTHRFDDFAEHLGIARNVLSARLSKLVEHGILQQEPLDSEARRYGYHLTLMGLDLLPVLVSLMQWGDRWLQTPASIPLQIVERKTGKKISDMRPSNKDGKALNLKDLDWLPGPGAADPRIAALVTAYESQRTVAPRAIPSIVSAADRPSTSNRVIKRRQASRL
ncbi:MAG: helix-turn-helix domain-containing protein [Pseudomonadota bacterium]